MSYAQTQTRFSRPSQRKPKPRQRCDDLPFNWDFPKMMHGVVVKNDARPTLRSRQGNSRVRLRKEV